MKIIKRVNRPLNFESLLSDLVLYGLKQDKDKVELLAVTLSRLIKNDYPTVSKKISELIGMYSMGNNRALRGSGISPVPVDNETQMDTATVLQPSQIEFQQPVLNPVIKERIDYFIQERENASKLLAQNIKPTTSLLVVGPPGTGKTMLGYYIAAKLEKNLVILDLAASISSLLGKTGYNLKKVLKYARQTSSVLLLDEFDAIAKRRDDVTDLGELKRVVNVLLMELETWPVSSVVIATSNHPNLLDKAIWRRFDSIIQLDLPGQEERIELLKINLLEFLETSPHYKDILIKPLAELLDNYSAADICKFSERVKRRIILKKQEPLNSYFHELNLANASKDTIGKFCKLAKQLLGETITVRELAEMTRLSPAGVQYHITKE